MNKFLFLFLISIPAILPAQQKLYLGLNLPSLLMGTVDLSLERHLTATTALQFGAGFRIQNRDSTGDAFIKGLNNYTAIRNRGVFVMAGFRFFEDSPYEHPYLSFGIVGSYYNETIVTSSNAIEKVEGFNLGVTMTIGVVFNLGSRLALDAALQLGYSTPREEPPNYYLTGIGYSTFGLDVIGVKGGHFQPVLTLKYNLVKDKRQRLYEQE